MNVRNKFPVNLDSVVGLVTGVLLLSITFVIWVGSRQGIRVTAELPADKVVGPLETLTFHFSEPVDPFLVTGKFYIYPVTDGSFKWNDSKTLQFNPRQPFQPDTAYTVAFAPGAWTQDGRLLIKGTSWTFHIRSPLVAYLETKNGKGSLWTVDLQTSATTQLTDASLNVFGFDTAHNGEFIVFSAFNAQKGADLWRVERTGGTPTLLLQCGPDRCSLPAIAFYDQRVAYVREAASPTADLQFGSPRIWMLDLSTRQNSPLYEDQQIIGYNPVWSPDGTRLASYDGFKDELRLLDILTGNQLTIPSQTGTPLTWSGDSNTFVFTDIATNEFGVYTQIREAKLNTNEIITLFGDKDQWDYHYNSLAWSPAENKLVIGLRFNKDDPSEALWLIDTTTLGGQVIANQPGYVYNNPQWDPWGKALVFQQFKLKGVYKPELGLWMPGLDEPRILAEGIMPHWLP